MSLILDALRKSEHGRHGASDSVLPLIVTPRAGRARKKRVAYLPILIMLLVVIMSVAIFFFRETIFPPRTVTRTPPTPTLAKPQVTQQSQQQRRAEAPIKEAKQASTHGSDPTQSIAQIKSEKPPVIRPEITIPASAVAESAKVVKRSPPTKPESATAPEPKTKLDPIPKSIPKSIAKSRPESIKRDVIPAALSTFPADFIRKVQPLHLDFHVYSSDVSRRMVYINNREYIEGDRLKNSLIVVRIVPRGAVLQWNQQLFLLTAQD